MNTTQKGITLLLRSGITGEKLPLPAGFSLEEAFPMLKKHSVVLLAYQGAVNCGLDKADPVMQKMLQIYYRTLMSHEKQMKALDSLFAAFEARGIAYMPVKGCNIKKLYPKPEMRPMGDVDILIHREEHEQICPIMEGLGYQFREEDDHVFTWCSNDLHVELHKTLIRPAEEDFFCYYGTGWQLAVKGDGHRHDLSAEDAYLFLFTHFTKHYRSMGIGIRHIVDLYVYRKAYPNLDMTYVAAELDKLRLREFHRNIMRTLDAWFAGAEGDEVTELITAYVFSSGNWGLLENYYYSQEVKNAKKARGVRNSGFRALLRAFFPSYATMSRYYDVLQRIPVLLPVFWMVRWLEILLFRRKTIRKKLRIIRKIDDDGVLSHQEALQAVGLDFYFDIDS